MWLWGCSFCSPLSVTSGWAGGVRTEVAADGWVLRGVSALASEHTLLLRPAYLWRLDSSRRRCEEEAKWLGTVRWGRAGGLKRRDWAGGGDTAVALAATIPMSQVWAATGRSPNWGSTIALMADWLLSVCLMAGGRWGREDVSMAAPPQDNVSSAEVLLVLNRKLQRAYPDRQHKR